MNRDELKPLFVGPIATVPTPFDDNYEVDFSRMHDLTQRWVEGGLVTGRSVIKVAAAMGEGPMLSDDEWPFLVRTVVQASDAMNTFQPRSAASSEVTITHMSVAIPVTARVVTPMLRKWKSMPVELKALPVFLSSTSSLVRDRRRGMIA